MPSSDLPLSQSEDALQATQVDDVELPVEEEETPLPAPNLSQRGDSVSEKVPVTNKRAKNSMYAQMLLEEERQAKKQVRRSCTPSRPHSLHFPHAGQKTTPASKFLETEAEEDEEEGRQAGLGDFGFVIQKTHEDEEEVSPSHMSGPCLCLTLCS